MRRPRVYVSGPILTSGSFHENIRNGAVVGEELRRLGFTPVVPHLYDFAMFLFGETVPYEEMIAMDMELVASSDIVVRLPGESKGGDREVAEAERNGIKVFKLQYPDGLFGSEKAELYKWLEQFMSKQKPSETQATPSSQ